jgi:hypothetical protein
MRKSAFCAVALIGALTAAQAYADVAPAPRVPGKAPPPVMAPPPPPPLVAPPPGPLFVYGPNHYIAVGALYMTRTRGEDRTFVVHEENDFNANDDRSVISSRSLDPFDDWQPGVEARFGIRLGDPWWLTADVFWIHGFLGEQRARIKNELALAGLSGVDGQGDLASIAFDDAERVLAGQSSTILGTDINVKYWWQPWFYVGVGFRYVRLHEDVELTFWDRKDVGSYNFTATNNIFAGQLVAGVKWGFWGDRVHLSLSGSAGAAYNYASSNQSLIDSPGTLRLVQEENSDSGFSFVGTGRAEASIAIWPWLRIYGGYQFMYLTGVALAQNQYSAQVVSNESPGGYRRNVGVDTDSDVFYHGGFLGLKVTW